MLYDQALHVLAYAAAFQVTGKPEYRRTVDEVIAYCLRDLLDARGAFHSAEDADSEGEEGRFYLWTREQVLEVLGAEEGELWARVYEITPEGNFREEASGEQSGPLDPAPRAAAVCVGERARDDGGGARRAARALAPRAARGA
jgi:uncharacterized protein YyaL (SSP411 family)